jgi:hypothetical protein
MNSTIKENDLKLDTLYEKDFYGWIDHHIDLLRQGKFAEIDTELLIEELENMANQDKNTLASRFIIMKTTLTPSPTFWDYRLIRSEPMIKINLNNRKNRSKITSILDDQFS